MQPLHPAHRLHGASVSSRNRRLMAALGVTAVFVLALLSTAGRPSPALALPIWAADTSPTTERLLDVACVSTNFCKAVGGDFPEDGTATRVILSWNGVSWSHDSTPIGQNFRKSIEGVACVSSSFCKALGFDGTFLAWNGANWSEESTPTFFQGEDVTCLSDTFCKAVDAAGKILSWNGTNWVQDTSPTTERLNAISCVTTSFCKAVGGTLSTSGLPAGSTILTWDGMIWSLDASPSSAFLKGVGCVTINFCKAVGDGKAGVFLTWGGSTWSVDMTPANQPFFVGDVACVSPSFCKAGSGGRMFSWDGSRWNTDVDLEGGGSPFVRGIACVSTSFCKAVDTDGQILSYFPDTDLTVTITDTPDPVLAGMDLTYTIVATNAGPVAAHTVGVGGMLPANTTFVSFSAPAGWTPVTPPVGGTGSAGAGRGMVPAGSGPQTFTLVVRVAETASENVTNTVDFGAINGGNPANNTATATTRVTPPPDTTPPDTSITSQPANPSNGTTARFSFTGTDGTDTPRPRWTPLGGYVVSFEEG